MENNPIRKLSDEQRTQQLREGAHRKRPWTMLRIVVTVLFFAIPIGALVWLVYPRPKPPELIVIAFDQLAVAGEKAKLQAQLILQQPEADGQELEGIPVVFEQEITPNAKAVSSPKPVAADKRGLASKWRTFSEKTSKTAFRVFARSGDKQRKVWDHGNVFIYPKTSKLLLIEVENTLPSSDQTNWKTVNVHDVKPAEKAVAFLKKATADKYRPVYFAFEQDSVWEYRKVRGWMETNIARQMLPPGPVLGRFSDGGSPRSETLKRILEEFDGPVVALVKNGAVPEPYRKLKVKTVTVDDSLP